MIKFLPRALINRFAFSEIKPQTIETILQTSSNITIRNYSEAGLPLNIRGQQDASKIRKEYDELILNKDELSLHSVTLMEIMRKYVENLSNDKWEYDTWIDPSLYINSKKALYLLKKSGFEFSFEKKSDSESLQIIQIHHYHGLSINRGDNVNTKFYKINDKYSMQGLDIYNPLEWIVNKQTQKTDFETYKKTQCQMVLRLFAQISLPYKLKIKKNNSVVVESDSNFHYAVFESQLKSPPKFSFAEFEFLEWVKMYKVKNWRLADVDCQWNDYPLIVTDKTNWQAEYKV